MAKSGEKWEKVRKKWPKVGKSCEKWEKVSGGKVGKVVKSGKKW